MDDTLGDIWELDELLAVFDVKSMGGDRFLGAPAPERLRHEPTTRAMVDGSQILAQSIVAASRTESDRFVKSGHMIFARAASAAEPIDLVVERMHSGRSFSSLSVSALQADRLCARGLFLLDTAVPDFVHHAEPMPELPGPDACDPLELPLRGRELRLLEGSDYASPEAVGPPSLHVWVQYDPTPTDPVIRQALLAHLCGPFTIGVSMRPHAGVGEAQAHRTLSTAVLSLTVRFHEACALDGWLLYSHQGLHAGRGLCDGAGRIFEQTGRLVGSFEQEGLLRPLPPERSAKTRTRNVL